MGKKARLATRERVAQMRAEQQRSDRRRNLTIVGAAVLVALAVAGVVTLVVIDQRRESDFQKAVQTFKNLKRDHTDQPVTYPQSPPVGGNHNSIWQNCGIYDKPVKNENAVHSLEHGAVWVTYRPDLPAAGVTQLREAVEGIDYTLLSPYPNLPAPVVASAWGKQLKLTGPGDKRLTGFLRAHVKGPQTPEPGAACSGGLGQPLP